MAAGLTGMADGEPPTGLSEAIDILRAEGRYAEARDLARRRAEALEVGDGPRTDGEFATAWLETGRGEADLGRHEVALEAWQRALAFGDGGARADDPVRVQALGELAAMHAFLGSPAAATETADEATALATALAPAVQDGAPVAWALANAAMVAAEAGRDDLAGERLRGARAALPGEPASAREARAAVAVATAAGDVHRLRGRYAEALEAYAAALALAERTLGTEAVEVAAICNGIGVCGKFAGRFDEAAAAYERALAIVTRAGGESHPDVASILHNLGGLAHARGDHGAAEGPARRAVELREATLGADHPLAVRDRTALAAILDALGRGDEAATILRPAIDRLEASLGPGHPEVAVALNNLAAIEARSGHLDDAAALYERAVAIKTIAEASPLSIAITVNNLATVHRRLGRHADAEAGYRRALALLDGVVAPDHPAIASIQANLRVLGRARAPLVTLEPRRPATGRPPEMSGD